MTSVFQAKVKAAVAPKSVAQKKFSLMHVLNGFGIYGCFQKQGYPKMDGL